MSLLSSLFRRPQVIAPVSVRAGDDLVVSLRDRLDSNDAFALLDTLKQQFPSTCIHLLTGFGDVQVQRHDGGSNGRGGDDRRDPPLPVGGPAPGKPASRMAAAREKGGVVVITCATQFRLIAVYIPPKQPNDSVLQAHVSPLKAWKMNNKQVISAALSALTAAAMTRCATTDLPALLELHNTAANAVSALPDTGPLAGSGSSCTEFAVGTLVADETQPLILAELRKHTVLLEVLAKQGDAAPPHITPAVAPDANDPFAPTFEVTPSFGGYTATIAMREGSVVYLVNATGPRSNAIKVSAAGLSPVLVEPISEIPL